MLKLWIFITLILAACQADQPAPGSVDFPKAESITCTTAYRSDVSQGIEREQSITFGDGRAEESIQFTDLIFNAAYYSGEADNERNLRVWVTPVDAEDVILSQLYQLPQDAGPVNQFVGGHGFTGLNYVYHPTSTAELQFWCAVD